MKKIFFSVFISMMLSSTSVHVMAQDESEKTNQNTAVSNESASKNIDSKATVTVDKTLKDASIAEAKLNKKSSSKPSTKQSESNTGKWVGSDGKTDVTLANKPPKGVKKGTYTGDSIIITDKNGQLIGLKHQNPKGYKWVDPSAK